MKRQKKYLNFIMILIGCFVFLFAVKKDINVTASVAQSKAVNVTSAPAMPGDINHNGKVDMEDANLALKAALGTITLTGDAFRAADYNGNGTIDMEDAQIILNLALGVN